MKILPGQIKMLDKLLARLFGPAIAAGLMLAAGAVQAQMTLPGAVPAPDIPAAPAAPAPPVVPEGQGGLRLIAMFGENDKPTSSGLVWRVFRERAEPDGTHKLVRRSTDVSPFLILPYGNYVVHVAWGLAGATARVEVKDKAQRARLVLNAGALQITAMLAEKKISRDRLTISIYIPEPRNPEAKLIARGVRPGDVVGLPVGTYHIVSTYLDASGAGTDEKGRATNSVVDTDARVRPGQLTEAILKHRAAQLTFKLVKAPGGEAMANTAFTVLTPGGDVLREMIGAFPKLVLAEGEYVAIARNEGKTYQSTFKVVSGESRDVEILVK